MNIFKFYKKYKELNTILKWIKRAKKLYIEDNLDGMCASFVLTSEKVKLKGRDKDYLYISEKDINKFIPEFNPEYLNAVWIDTTTWMEIGYWWPIADRESRIKAFDKLIALYETKLSERL